MEINEMSLVEKMACIRDELGVVAKNLEIAVSNTNRYKAVGEPDVINAVKPLMKKYRVYSYPISRECDERDKLINVVKYGDKETTRTNLYFHYKNVMRFVNLDDRQDTIDVVSFSTGIDSGDKADGKAMTYADKYAYMKAFMISTGEDPDQEASKEYKTTINNNQWETLKKMYSADEIKAMYKELGITSAKEFPVDFFEKKKEEYNKKFDSEHPDKEFF